MELMQPYGTSRYDGKVCATCANRIKTMSGFYCMNDYLNKAPNMTCSKWRQSTTLN